MKRFSLTISLLTITLLSFAQSYTLTPYVERTVITPKAGLAIGTTLSSGWEFGTFYQRTLSQPTVDESLVPKYFENEFFGAYGQHRVYQYEGNVLSLNIRGGLMNRTKVLLAPSLRYELVLSKRVSFDAGLGGAAVGTGTFRPTMIAGIKIRS